ncbi:MAG: AAA family ATPase [Alphaproteobacteria bacterium]|nr:AAA family ATPase [Alphaproteobacteria bacterium]
MAHKAHVIVVGNEKGGSGKSTVAMHLAVGLLRLGYQVGTVDLDSHQATFTNYLKNRWDYVARTHESLPSPEHIHIDHARGVDVMKNRDEERWRVESVIKELNVMNDFIVVDTPGSDRFMSMVGHSYADTLITPMNDSFIDLDLLAKMDATTHKMVKPSVYTQMVWDLRRQRKEQNGTMMQWYVMRNRLAVLDSRNKQDIHNIMQDLQYELGFRIAPGFTDRVIYRELFLNGLTLLDLREGEGHALNMSNINARQEVRSLVRRILPQKDVSTLSLLKTY